MRTFKKKFVPMQSTAVELTIGKNKIKVQFDKLKRVCSVKKILEDESLEIIPTLWYRIIGRKVSCWADDLFGHILSAMARRCLYPGVERGIAGARPSRRRSGAGG